MNESGEWQGHIPITAQDLREVWGQRAYSVSDRLVLSVVFIGLLLFLITARSLETTEAQNVFIWWGLIFAFVMLALLVYKVQQDWLVKSEENELRQQAIGLVTIALSAMSAVAILLAAIYVFPAFAFSIAAQYIYVAVAVMLCLSVLAGGIIIAFAPQLIWRLFPKYLPEKKPRRMNWLLFVAVLILSNILRNTVLEMFIFLPLSMALGFWSLFRIWLLLYQFTVLIRARAINTERMW